MCVRVRVCVCVCVCVTQVPSTLNRVVSPSEIIWLLAAVNYYHSHKRWYQIVVYALIKAFYPLKCEIPITFMTFNIAYDIRVIHNFKRQSSLSIIPNMPNETIPRLVKEPWNIFGEALVQMCASKCHNSPPWLYYRGCWNFHNRHLIRNLWNNMLMLLHCNSASEHPLCFWTCVLVLISKGTQWHWQCQCDTLRVTF